MDAPTRLFAIALPLLAAGCPALWADDWYIVPDGGPGAGGDADSADSTSPAGNGGGYGRRRRHG